MKFTNKTIANTKSNPLKVILTNMKPQIEKGIEMCVAQEIAMHIDRNPNYSVSEFGKECIEMSLIYDLFKSVVSYTNPSDEVKEFESGVSLKGNYEMSGTIIRDGKEYGFISEAIIADGAINRAHYRYITRTSLPKGSMEEANKVKAIIKKYNKVKSIETYRDQLIRFKQEAQDKYDEGMTITREEHKQTLVEEGKWLENNYDELYKEGFAQMRGWNNEQDYIKFLDKANEGQIDSRIEHIGWSLTRVNQLTKSIKNEEVKLNKAKAL